MQGYLFGYLSRVYKDLYPTTDTDMSRRISKGILDIVIAGRVFQPRPTEIDIT